MQVEQEELLGGKMRAGHHKLSAAAKAHYKKHSPRSAKLKHAEKAADKAAMASKKYSKGETSEALKYEQAALVEEQAVSPRLKATKEKVKSAKKAVSSAVKNLKIGGGGITYIEGGALAGGALAGGALAGGALAGGALAGGALAGGALAGGALAGDSLAGGSLAGGALEGGSILGGSEMQIEGGELSGGELEGGKTKRKKTSSSVKSAKKSTKRAEYAVVAEVTKNKVMLSPRSAGHHLNKWTSAKRSVSKKLGKNLGVIKKGTKAYKMVKAAYNKMK